VRRLPTCRECETKLATRLYFGQRGREPPTLEFGYKIGKRPRSIRQDNAEQPPPRPVKAWISLYEEGPARDALRPISCSTLRRALGLRGGVVAGKISCSPHPLRSTKQPSASWRNSILLPVSRLSHPFRGGGCRSAPSRAGRRRRRGIALLARWLIRGRETELGSVKPHAMHDHGELARHRHERALMTAFGRKAQAPRLHGAVLLRSRHHRVGRLIKRGSHLAVATS
jgi:hypothetical protein